ncbi:MAG: S26 family signal peptidase [Planctomycetota bacterium]
MKSRTRAVIVFLTVIAFATVPILAHRWGREVRPKGDFRVLGDSMWPTLRSGQICRVIPTNRPLAVGDVVAILVDGKRRVKRVAALPGQEVRFAEGRLLVDSVRLEEWLATQAPKVPPSPVAVETSPDSWGRSEDGQWLIYRHRNSHVGQRVTAVMDDYPINESVKRQLNPVDHLIVQVDPPGSSSDASHAAATEQLIVDFFVEGVIRRGRFESGLARSRDATLRLDDDALDDDALAAESPIRIRAVGLPDEIQFHVFREIEYRRGGPSGFHRFPLVLEEGDVFVVGDNVPVSVDSRSFGPIAIDDVLGLVEVVTNPSSQDRL